MAAPPDSATILDRCRVGPPPDGCAATEQTFPLTFFDIPLAPLPPNPAPSLLPIPLFQLTFPGKIVPTFKNSLSQTLKRFLPLTGNLFYPLDPQTRPEIRYIPGDSVSITIAESNEAHDFNHLTGNHPRISDDFYAFFPDLPPPENDSGFKKISLFAVQITLFPGAGICIGFSNNHSVGDASSIVGFIKAWSSVAKFDGDYEFLAKSDLHPIYDRSLVKDPSGLLNIYWNQIKDVKIESLPLNFPLNKVRATYILQKHDIQKLKNFVQAKNPALLHLSSYTITTAYVWSCLAMSAAVSGEDVDNNEPEYFAFAVDARPRTNPPIPEAYFGNCLALAVVETTHSELAQKNGFLIAVERIGDVIGNKVNNKDELFSDAAEWQSKFGGMIGKRLFGVAGSPKFDLYDADFGWGKPKKYEAVAIDGDGSMSLCKSREFEGGLEIGLSLPQQKMDAFAALFADGLKI